MGIRGPTPLCATPLGQARICASTASASSPLWLALCCFRTKRPSETPGMRRLGGECAAAKSLSLSVCRDIMVLHTWFYRYPVLLLFPDRVDFSASSLLIFIRLGHCFFTLIRSICFFFLQKTPWRTPLPRNALATLRKQQTEELPRLLVQSNSFNR